MRESTYPAFPKIILIVPQAFLVLAGGLATFVVIASLFVFGFHIAYTGRIYPGISIAGLDVSGVSLKEAADLLNQELDYPQNGRISLQDGDTKWVAAPVELGFFLDSLSSAQAAYRVGRQGSLKTRLREQFETWFTGKDLPPLVIYNEDSAQEYLTKIAGIVNRPTVEAEIGINGIEVEVHSGQVGRTLDVEATLEPLEPLMETLSDGNLPLIIRETPPVILDVSAQADMAREILSAPLAIQIPKPREGDPDPWTFEPESLAGMLSIERVQDPEGNLHYRVALNPDSLRSFLESIAPSLEIDPVNARFIFNDETRQLEVIAPSVTGRALLIDESIEKINRRVAEGKHTVNLVFDDILPAATSDSTAAELGITELVSAQTSYFYGSSSARIHNIATAAANFHGLLVAPGETFSMAAAMGDVSLDTGYAEALIIYGDRTIKGVGGGVCQVSTTFFRTVFFGGYQIDERHPHAYRVYYYELAANGSVNTRLAGLDATVYVPLVDFKFTNDSPYWLLMETYVNQGARSITWKFYSTSDGRQVTMTTTGLQNRVDPPEPLYTENPALAKGEIKQVDWAVEGADVTITRTVTSNGEVIHEDFIATHYRPWRAVYEYGPGTKGIPGQGKKKDK